MRLNRNRRKKTQYRRRVVFMDALLRVSALTVAAFDGTNERTFADHFDLARAPPPSAKVQPFPPFDGNGCDQMQSTPTAYYAGAI
jgi:hypothetical protein